MAGGPGAAAIMSLRSGPGGKVPAVDAPAKVAMAAAVNQARMSILRGAFSPLQRRRRQAPLRAAARFVSNQGQ
jgi:hypothetical protein